jgi:hypothetical protein
MRVRDAVDVEFKIRQLQIHILDYKYAPIKHLRYRNTPARHPLSQVNLAYLAFQPRRPQGPRLQALASKTRTTLPTHQQPCGNAPTSLLSSNSSPCWSSQQSTPCRASSRTNVRTTSLPALVPHTNIMQVKLQHPTPDRAEPEDGESE